MKNLIRTYIIEDEIAHAKMMESQVLAFSVESQLVEIAVYQVQELTHFYKNLETFSFLNTDLFIIDIHLNTFFNGIQLAQKIRELNEEVSIIFLTFDPSKGIEVINSQIHPLGYIVKNSSSDLFFQEELRMLLKGVEQKLSEEDENKLMVRSGRTKLLFQFSEIYYITSIKSKRNKVAIKSYNQEIICDAKLSDLKSQLLSPNFYTELKSYIINFDFIQSYNRIEGTLTFKDNSELYFGTKVITKISRAFRSYLERSKN